jgi:hypothetical protein
MKIRYAWVLLFLGVTLQASANNDRNHWNIPVSQDVIHEIATGSHDDLNNFFASHDFDQSKLTWIFGNLHEVLGDLKDHWHWDKSPFCDWPPVSSVPEPGTYAMLLAGLGMMGAMARRKKKTGA